MPHFDAGLFGLSLTHYCTMPHFDAVKIYSCGKHCEKRRNCLLVGQNAALCGNGLKCRLQFVSIWTSLKLCHLVMG